MFETQPDTQPETNPEIESDNETEIVETESQETPQKEVASPEAQAVQKMIKKLKLKVDGEEFEEDYDLSNEQQLIKDLQLARAAKKRMLEANNVKKDAYQIIEQYKNDPEGLIEALGERGFEAAEKILLKKLQAQAMTPEQRELMEYKRKVEEYEKKEKFIKEQQEQEKLMEMERQQAESYQKTIIDALNKTGLPKNEYLVKRAAALLKQNLKLGLDLDATDLAAEIKKEVTGMLQAVTKDADAEQALGILGDDLALKIRKRDIEKLKEKRGMGTKTPSQTSMPRPSSQKEKKFLTPEEWRAQLDERIKSSED